MNWELIHRFNSILLGAFIVSHIGVHLMAVASPEAHSSGLSTMRQFYANPFYEAVLLLSVLIQIVSGWAEFQWFPKSGWRVARNLSGAYLLLFMAVHIASVLYARHWDSVPTDFYWAAGGFAYGPIQYAAPAFYGLGVFSFFAHMIAVTALYWKGAPENVIAFLWLFSVTVTGLILLAFSGAFYEIDMPSYVTEHYETALRPLLDWLGGE